MASNVVRRLIKVWHKRKVVYEFQLQEFKPKSDSHSCYGCYDDSPSRQRRCPNNEDRWDTVAQGDAEWAERTARHYHVTVPEEEFSDA